MMAYGKAHSQTHCGIEQYYYSGNQGGSTIVPRVYYQNKKNWYAEVRYNYDELETFSFNAGKTFSKDGLISYSVTPLVGAVAGKFNGALLGMNAELNYKNLFFSSESQSTFSSENKQANFSSNWSELGYQATSNIYTGLALQLTRLYQTENAWEPGVMLGFSFNKFTFPVYAFNPLTDKKYFVVGINWQWQHSRRESTNTPLLAKTEE